MKNLHPETVTLLRMAQQTASPELAKEIDLMLAEYPQPSELPSPGLAKAFHQLVTHGGTVLVNPPAPESPVPSESGQDREYQISELVERRRQEQEAMAEDLAQMDSVREKVSGLDRETRARLEQFAREAAGELRSELGLDHPPSVEPHP